MLSLVSSFLSLLYNPVHSLYLPYFPSFSARMSLLYPHCWSHIIYPQYLHSFTVPYFPFLPPVSSNFSPLTPLFAFEYFLLFSSTRHLGLCHSSSFSIINPRYQYYKIIISLSPFLFTISPYFFPLFFFSLDFSKLFFHLCFHKSSFPIWPHFSLQLSFPFSFSFSPLIGIHSTQNSAWQIINTQ